LLTLRFMVVSTSTFLYKNVKHHPLYTEGK
jgi:hypothetical protein